MTRRLFLSFLLLFIVTASSAQNYPKMEKTPIGIGYKVGQSWVAQPIYEDGSEFQNGMARVRLNGKWGFINTSGVLVVKNLYDACSQFGADGYAKAKIGDTYYWVDKSGHQYNSRKDVDAILVMRANPDPIKKETYRANDYIPTKDENEKWGYKQLGEWVISPKYEKAGDFGEGIAPVRIGGKWGFIDKDGKTVIPYKFESAGPLKDGLARVGQYGKFGFIDKTGAIVIPYKYLEAHDFSDGLARVCVDGKIGYIDKTGQWFDTRGDVYTTFSAYARYIIEKDINEWQRKGKYEKMSQWKERVTDAHRKERIKKLRAEAEERFIAREGAKVKFQMEIADYDSENENFLIYDNRFKNLIVSVPIGEAEYFEQNFAECQKLPTFFVNGDKIGLAELAFVMPNEKSYVYKSRENKEFAQIDIDYNFEKVNFEAAAAEVPANNNKLASKKVKVGLSDVDTNIPQTHVQSENTFVLIIANENYQLVSPVPFANSDGATFRNYCIKTLGVPEKQITYLPDGTSGRMADEIEGMADKAKVCNGEAKLIVYYAGHGVPDESSRDAYLMPVDASPKSLRTAVKLSELYTILNRYPTRSTMVFLDACFSGAKRDGQMLASARGVALKAKVEKPGGNMVVFSAASGDETAYPYQEKGHGLFSYFLFKKLQETKGEVSLGELADYLTSQVGRNAIVINQKSQTPSVIPSDSLADSWKELTLQ